ncbi:hypothetical protein [Amycolatopsis balhimycina]|nr:hypothetical protein [Amycolatopsis balhimycina]
MSLRESVRRCLVSAAGGVLAVLAVVLLRGQLCAGSGCLVVPILQEPLMLGGAWVLSWVTMALGRVRPAWPVALAGPMVAAALVIRLIDVAKWPLAAILAVVAAGYALAAVMTAAGLSPAWRIALVTPMVVLFAWSVVPHLVPAP